jgi:hypothetical protein
VLGKSRNGVMADATEGRAVAKGNATDGDVLRTQSRVGTAGGLDFLELFVAGYVDDL